MNWLLFFWIVFKAVLFSTGGLGPLPSLHHDFIAYGWASEQQFTEALAVGQIAPGPNGLWVVSLCYLTAGLPGAVLSVIALLIPPLSILLIRVSHSRVAGYPATEGLLDGIILVIVSFSLIVLTGIFYHNGLNIGLILIAVLSAVLALTRRAPVWMILVVAAIIGWLWG